MYQGLVEPSCASSFTATVVTAMGTDGAQRLCADYWALNSPTIRHAYLLPPEVDVEMLNFLHGADPLFSIGLRGGYMQDLMYAGLVETANSVTGSSSFASFLPWLMGCADERHVPGVRCYARPGG